MTPVETTPISREAIPIPRDSSPYDESCCQSSSSSNSHVSWPSTETRRRVSDELDSRRSIYAVTRATCAFFRVLSVRRRPVSVRSFTLLHRCMTQLPLLTLVLKHDGSFPFICSEISTILITICARAQINEHGGTTGVHDLNDRVMFENIHVALPSHRLCGNCSASTTFLFSNFDGLSAQLSGVYFTSEQRTISTKTICSRPTPEATVHTVFHPPSIHTRFPHINWMEGHYTNAH